MGADAGESMSQWLLVTLTAGIGGSMISFGSAAGVGVMGKLKGIYTFGAHMKYAWMVVLGYIVSLIVWYVQFEIFHSTFKRLINEQYDYSLDFGSQYTQLIARRLREEGVYTEILPFNAKLSDIKAKDPKGIILSGGPASVLWPKMLTFAITASLS